MTNKNTFNTTEKYTKLDRFFGLFTKIRPGEGHSIVLFFFFIFIILVAYYILKTIREPLLLEKSTPEIRSYASAVIAGLLLVVVPFYSQVSRHISKVQLTQLLTVFFILNLIVFYILGHMNVDIGFAYFVWVGIISLMITAQFWGYAADTYNLKSGERLFPVIMSGATLGGIVGPLIAGSLYNLIGPLQLMIIVALLLACTLPLVSLSRNAVPIGSRCIRYVKPPDMHFLGGLTMVLQDRFLLLIASLMVILNWINTTGEYILAEYVISYANQLISADNTINKGEVIAIFYSQFYFIVNIITLLLQVFIVARVFRWIGIRGALFILPIVAFIGYGLVAFIPVYSIIRFVKIAENSTDYSLMNTSRHTLYLPLSISHKFEGKTCVETFFWRLGDLIQAGVIFIGLNWLDFEPQHFALVNMALSIVWIWIAYKLGAIYQQAAKADLKHVLPTITRPLVEHHLKAGMAFSFFLPDDSFKAPGPGDVLSISAKLVDGTCLPNWLTFNNETLEFSGCAPLKQSSRTKIIVEAKDFDGDFINAAMELHYY